MRLDVYDEIKKNVDIVDIIGSYIALSRVGKNYKGLCPFHNDSHPSLTVSPEKQIFTCWSCGETGNVITFVQKIEKISFHEAAIKVCKLGGIPIPSELQTQLLSKDTNEYKVYYDLLKVLSNFYSYCLRTTTNQQVLDYVKSRNLTKEDLENYEIGFCPESGLESIQFLRQKGYKDDEIISCGVAIESSNHQLIDRLRGRLIYTICNADGQECGFSGRKIIESLGEKYVNTVDTKFFHKQNVLYNYHNAIINSKKDGYCYVVEGYMDAIALSKAGIKNVVATMGTAFTESHIKLLNHLRCEIRLMFDSDEPGQNATNNCLKALVGSNLRVKIVKPIDPYKDIDECLQQAGKEKVNELINNLISENEYKIAYLAKHTNFKNHEETKKFINDCCKILSRYIDDELDKDYYIKIISQYSDVSTKLVSTTLDKYLNKEIDNRIIQDFDTPYEVVQKALNKYDLADHQILKMMMTNNLSILQFTNLQLDLCSKEARSLANLIIDRYSKGLSIDPVSLLDQADSIQARMIGQIEGESFPPTKIEQLAHIIKDEYYQQLKEDDLRRQIDETESISEQARLAQELLNEKFKKN